jgi:hypothetical protein
LIEDVFTSNLFLEGDREFVNSSPKSQEIKLVLLV